MERIAGPASGRTPNIEERAAWTSAGRSSSDLGGEPRGPNNIRSFHNAVMFVSTTLGLRIGMPPSASAGWLSSPNSASANRHSISCCRSARASRGVAHDGAAAAETQYPALIPIRLDARTTAGAQTASEARPRRNRRRGTIKELIFRDLPAPADEYMMAVASRQRAAPTTGARISMVFCKPPPDLAGLSDFVDIPNRGSSQHGSCASRNLRFRLTDSCLNLRGSIRRARSTAPLSCLSLDARPLQCRTCSLGANLA
jgi:hypothetical protein